MNASTSDSGPFLRHTLVRYFFFGWLFRDVNRGNLRERVAAWRHNQHQARWLHCYLRRWLTLGVLLTGMGVATEMGFAQPFVSTIFYVPGLTTLPVCAVVVATWVGLKTLPDPC